jgi:hypothetical protein
MFRVVFYVFIIVILIQSVHHRIIEAKIEEKFSSQMNKEILSAVKGGDITTLLGAGGKINIKPKYMKPHNKEDENSTKEYNHENSDGGNEFIVGSDEEILNHILGAADQYKKENTNSDIEESSDDGNSHKDDGHKYGGSPRVKVSGASVEDMLAELGV